MSEDSLTKSAPGGEAASIKPQPLAEAAAPHISSLTFSLGSLAPLVLPLKTRIVYASGMKLADEILSLVTRKPGLSEVEIAKHLFGRLGYQQRVNSTCRKLAHEDRIERCGNGGPGHPFISIVRKGSWILPRGPKGDERPADVIGAAVMVTGNASM